MNGKKIETEAKLPKSPQANWILSNGFYQVSNGAHS
jgi:hypothetical protein